MLYDFNDALRLNLNVPIGGWMAYATDGLSAVQSVWSNEPTDKEINEFLNLLGD